MEKVITEVNLSTAHYRIEKELTIDLSQGTFLSKEDVKMVVLGFFDDIPDDAWIEIKPAAMTAFWPRIVKEVGIPDDRDQDAG